MKITHTIKAALVAVSLVSAAQAASIAYVSSPGEPWGLNGADALPAAMNAAFGSGNWDRKLFSDGASLLSGSYDFIYIDGGDGNSGDFENYVNAHRTALENFVAGGGSLFMNAARWTYGNFNLGFGATLIANYQTSASAATLHPIFDGTTGTSWTGSGFSHDYVVGAGLTTLIVNGSNQSVLSERTWGNGYVMLGGQTTPYFHNPDPQAFNLRVNELKYAANQSNANVPDSGSSAALLVISGLGLIAVSRRRR